MRGDGHPAARAVVPRRVRDLRDAYQVAYLRDGARGVASAGVTELVARKVVRLSGEAIAIGDERAGELSPVEAALAAQAERGTKLAELVDALAPALGAVRATLEDRGLVLPRWRERLAQAGPFAVAALVPVLGMAKVLFLSEGRPVSLLVMLSTLSAMTAVRFLAPVTRSAGGDARLDEEKARYLASDEVSSPSLGVGLFGLSSLTAGPLGHVAVSMREESTSFGYHGGACGSGGCGGGGCGGGGCGGGCGGCGG